MRKEVGGDQGMKKVNESRAGRGGYIDVHLCKLSAIESIRCERCIHGINLVGGMRWPPWVRKVSRIARRARLCWPMVSVWALASRR